MAYGSAEISIFMLHEGTQFIAYIMDDTDSFHTKNWIFKSRHLLSSLVFLYFDH